MAWATPQGAGRAPVRAACFAAFLRFWLALYLRREIARAILSERPCLLDWVIAGSS